ncbi:DEAD/DEAH box helicase [Ornithinimicrobium cryptoxanthini]|uniref:DEAD/DEAH box helicase n=1 Tax=Ornithinimicrobium cryptoxanthini TaxID=2934161 RepID=A0ABY4YM08_9MICO|nr:DEAD/DEAH box helicase [Ornithinimicrobium cryptoxanthini]USQ77601.1 DEAD/DEAH box helicase [Ornithinimicrobium cryptoxanthini]
MAKAIGRASAPSHKKKPRHTAAQKKSAAKARELSDRSSRRDDRKSYAEKPAREDRPRREWNRDDRPARDDRGPRRDFDNRGPRRDFDNRGPRREWNRDDRPARDDRGPRREWNRDERPARDDRGPRRDFDNRGPRRDFDNRGPRREWNRDDRPARDDRGPRREWNRDERPTRDDRGPRRDFDNRGPRREWNRDDRPTRDFDRSAPRRHWDQDDRPRRRDDATQARNNHDWERRERRDNRHFSEDRERTPYSPSVAPAPKAAVVHEGPNEFGALGLNPQLVDKLTDLGLVKPFPIQAATIPDAMAGRDLLGRGQTGSGKTLAFGLPTLHRLAEGERAKPHKPHALIVTPTRELAMQILDALRPLLSTMRLRHQLVAGGMSYTPQLRSLEQGVDLLVATPGRLADLLERGAADLSEVKITVLDEADHMAEMGFVEAISEILDLTPNDGQRLLFSATLDHGVDKIAKKYLHDPVTHETDSATASVSTMEHHVFVIDPQHKKPVTATIANRPGRTVVFVRTKLGADRVALQLRESGVFAAALHGGLNQAQRTRVLEAFKSGELPVLVATDVAARGIHVDDVSLVLQADPPADHKDYLHRSGRTARAGEAGRVVTLALPHQRKQVQRLLDAAGVDASPTKVTPRDSEVLETAGGREPSFEAIPQSQLDNLLRPRRPQGRGNYRGRPQRRNGGFDRERGARVGGGYRGNRGDR